jgi:hypothetical protein
VTGFAHLFNSMPKYVPPEVFPVLLGSGKRLFPEDAQHKRKLTLVSSRTFADGVQPNILKPSR